MVQTPALGVRCECEHVQCALLKPVQQQIRIRKHKQSRMLPYLSPNLVYRARETIHQNGKEEQLEG